MKRQISYIINLVTYGGLQRRAEGKLENRSWVNDMKGKPPESGMIWDLFWKYQAFSDVGVDEIVTHARLMEFVSIWQKRIEQKSLGLLVVLLLMNMWLMWGWWCWWVSGIKGARTKILSFWQLVFTAVKSGSGIIALYNVGSFILHLMVGYWWKASQSEVNG